MNIVNFYFHRSTSHALLVFLSNTNNVNISVKKILFTSTGNENENGFVLAIAFGKGIGKKVK